MNSKDQFVQPTVLVTGSTGFLGSKIVENLTDEGFRVRAFVRKTSKTESLKRLGIELCIGDVADKDSLKTGFEGIDFIVHAAADTSGDDESGEKSTIQGTENVLSLCKDCGIKKLIYISSCNVYGVSEYNSGYEVTENSPLERYPEKRGGYTNSKFQAEKAVLNAMEENDFPIICLRPGTIYGPGGAIYTAMMGFSIFNKLFITIDNGSFILPLVYVENVADAVGAVLQKDMEKGQVFNLIDSYKLTKKEFIERVIKKIYPRAIFLNFPYSLLYSIVFLQEIISGLLKIEPFLTRYRLTSSQNKIIYNGEKINRLIDWTAPISLGDALQTVIDYEIQRKK